MKWIVVALAVVGAVVLIALDKMTSDMGIIFVGGIAAVIGIPKVAQMVKNKTKK
jgi:membrane-bound ClpP family serine protease